jgi:hypothetical protein
LPFIITIETSLNDADKAYLLDAKKKLGYWWKGNKRLALLLNYSSPLQKRLAYEAVHDR